MSDRTITGNKGLMGSIETRDPTLIYNKNAVRIDGKGYSGTIPVSAISAVFIGIKRLFPKPFLIAAIIAGVIGIGKGFSDFDWIAVLFLLTGIVGVVIYYLLIKAAFGITSGGYTYTLYVKAAGGLPDDWEAKKDELSEFVVAGRRQRQPMAGAPVAAVAAVSSASVAAGPSASVAADPSAGEDVSFEVSNGPCKTCGKQVDASSSQVRLYKVCNHCGSRL